MRLADRIQRPRDRSYIGLVVLAVSTLAIVALVAAPFAVAQDPNPTFVLNFWYSTSKMNSSGQTRFCIRATTRPAQPHHTVVVTVQRAKHGAPVSRIKGRFNG